MLIIGTQILIILFAELYLTEKFLYCHYKQKLLDCPYFLPQENFVFEEVYNNSISQNTAMGVAPIMEHSIIEGTQAEELFHELVLDLDVDVNIVNDSDELSLKDWVLEDEMNVLPSMSSKGTSKISDDKEGIQLWMVSVCGIEREFIHVSDGSRIWLNIGDLAKEIRHGDILSLRIKKENNCVEVLEVLDIQRLQHEDYCIPDEAEYYCYEDEIEIAEAV